MKLPPQTAAILRGRPISITPKPANIAQPGPSGAA